MCAPLMHIENGEIKLIVPTFDTRKCRYQSQVQLFKVHAHVDTTWH